jgi:hypothetical protein
MHAKRLIQQQVEDAMFRELERMGQMLAKELRALACGHGLRVFDILEQTLKDDMLKRHDRLHRELRRALEQGLEDRVLERIAAAVEREFENLETSGWLDRMPSGTEIGQISRKTKLFSALRADARIQANEVEAFRAWNKRQGRGRTGVWLEVVRNLDQEGMSHEWKNAYFEPWVTGLFEIVMQTQPGGERLARVDGLLTGLKLEARAREMAPGILEQCEKWKAYLGDPRPALWSLTSGCFVLHNVACPDRHQRRRMRIFVLTAALLALAGPPALAQSNVPEIKVSSYWREDVALESILSPPDTVYVGDTIHPAVMGMNYGRSARSAYMWCIIDNGVVGVYASIQGVTPPSRDSFVVTFAVPWIAELPGGDYYVRFAFPTGPPRDSWPENDSIGKHFIVLPREGGLDGPGPKSELISARDNDIGLLRIPLPPDTIHVGDSVHVSLEGMNHGYPRHVFMGVAIDDGLDRVVYATTFGITVPRGSFDLDFAVPWVALEPGEFSVHFRLARHDPWPENDSVGKRVAVLPREDGIQTFRSREPAGGEFRAVPSIVRGGGMISVSGLGPGSRAELIDAAGRVRGLLAPGSTAIAAPCLPGVYFIRREEDDRATRVLVHP